MTSPLSRELALRIGLAANELPDIDAGALIAILGQAVGLPLSEDKLANLGMKTFRQAGGEPFLQLQSDKLKTALRVLKGDGVGEIEEEFSLDAYEEGDMPGSIRIACASNAAEEMDGHFGSCRRFLVYQVSKDEVRLIDARSSHDENLADDKNKWRAGLIDDCDILYVVSIGGPAAAKVVRAGIHPIKRETGQACDILASLQTVLAGSPPPWLARVMGMEAKTLTPFLEEVEE